MPNSRARAMSAAPVRAHQGIFRGALMPDEIRTNRAVINQRGAVKIGAAVAILQKTHRSADFDSSRRVLSVSEDEPNFDPARTQIA